MPCSTKTISTSVTKIVADDPAREWLDLSLPSTAGQAVFIGIGDSDVSISNGKQLLPGELLMLDGPRAKRAVYGIVAATTETVHITTP